MKHNDALQIGAFFSRVVDTKEYQEVISTLRKTYVHDFLSTNWDNPGDRDLAYMRNLVLNDLEATINSFIALHAQAEQQLEFDLMTEAFTEGLID